MSSAAALEARLQRVAADIATLKERIAAARAAREHEAATGWETWGRPSDAAFSFSVRRNLRGHFGKVYALDWGGDTSTLVSASQDGKLIVWNAFTENKQEAVTLKSAWVMTCAIERDVQRYVASGGLDNTCTVFDLRQPTTPAYELVGHKGYLSSCRWIGESHMLTASGDGTCALWDAERATRAQVFADHAADVMSVATHPETPHVFASGSCDATVKIWDIRAGCCVRTFVGARGVGVGRWEMRTCMWRPRACGWRAAWRLNGQRARARTVSRRHLRRAGHLSDVNAVDFFPSGNAVGSGSDDASCRIFDLRAAGPISILTGERDSCGVIG